MPYLRGVSSDLMKPEQEDQALQSRILELTVHGRRCPEKFSASGLSDFACWLRDFDIAESGYGLSVNLRLVRGSTYPSSRQKQSDHLPRTRPASAQRLPRERELPTSSCDIRKAGGRSSPKNALTTRAGLDIARYPVGTKNASGRTRLMPRTLFISGMPRNRRKLNHNLRVTVASNK